MGARHSTYPQFEIPNFEIKIALYVLLAGIIFGVTSRIFTMTTHLVEKINARWISYAPLKPFIAGILLVLFYYIEGSYKYVGLGIPVIQDAINQPQGFREPILKTIFTALTVGSGFKGGEFIPLVFIGTTLGSALSVITPVSFQLLAGLGFAAVFSGAANTPIACSLMAMEIFGLKIAPYALISCFSGHHGIYRSQKIHKKKYKRFLEILNWFGSFPQRFINDKIKNKGE
jgi:H+/Cl- antiporter ClcA